MSNSYYNATGAPSTRSSALSATMRAEFAAIAAGLDLLPTLTANGGKIIAVNAGATALEPVTTTGTGNAVRATSPTLVTPILGTPTSGTLTNCTGLPVASGISGLGTGVATFLATPSSANLAAALTDESGTTTVAFTASPTFTGNVGIGAAGSYALHMYGDDQTFRIEQNAGLSGNSLAHLSSAGAANYSAVRLDGHYIYSRTDNGNVLHIGSGTAVADADLTVNTSTGAVGVAGDFAVNTDKFTVAAASGNTAIAGTLGVTGAITAGSYTNDLSAFAATTSAQLAGVISDETGSGALVFATSPTLVTPNVGVATATSINKVALTAPASSATLTISDGKTLTASNTVTVTATDGATIAAGGGITSGVESKARTTGTNTSGGDANATITYKRSGSIVTFAGNLLAGYTTTGASDLQIDLPIASNFTTALQCLGSGTAGGVPLRVTSDATNDRMQLSWTQVDAGPGTVDLYFTGQYQIL